MTSFSLSLLSDFVAFDFTLYLFINQYKDIFLNQDISTLYALLLVPVQRNFKKFAKDVCYKMKCITDISYEN